LIAAKIPDPCTAKRLITTAAKLPAIEWEEKYTQEFEKWATEMQRLVTDNITYYELQDMVLMEVSKLNAKAGMALLIVSDGIFVFNERGLLKDKDVEIVLGLIEHLRAEVKRMEMML
jgi:hypothetical protein